MRKTPVAIVVIGLGAFAGCVRASDSPPLEPATRDATTAGAQAVPPKSVDDEQASALKAIASSYATRMKKVSPRLNVAPTLCAAPVRATPTTIHMSRSDDASTHGKKVYYLYAANDDAYVKDGGQKGTTQPADQVLVKEAWAAVPVDDVQRLPATKRSEVVDADGKSYVAGDRGSLFIMARQGTGWRFGLVAPDGTTTTEGPATKSCHGCHDGQPDGLFGPKP